MITIKGIFYLDNSHNYDYNWVMKPRLLYLCIACLSLTLGGIYYLLFTCGTYLHSALYYLFPATVDVFPISCNNGVVRYYLADFLWALSLCSFLLAIFIPKKKGKIIIGTAVALYGLLWELLQHFGIISGTGDLFDILMYLLAAFAVTIIKIKGE